jgi:hypothetical protein
MKPDVKIKKLKLEVFQSDLTFYFMANDTRLNKNFEHVGYILRNPA